MTSEDRPPMPSTPPPSSPPPVTPPPATPMLEPDGTPGGLILPADLPTWAPAPPSSPEPADEPADEPATVPAEAPVNAFSEFAPPAGFAPPAPTFPAPTFPAPAPAPAPSFPAPSSQPPVPGGGHGAHGAGPAEGRGKLVGLIVGAVVVLALLVGGGFALFHKSSPKTSNAAPAAPAPVASPAGPTAEVSPSAAPASVPPVSEAPGAASTAAPTAAASPTVDANLGGMQAKLLQTTVIAPLKNLISVDLHVANADDNCVGLAPNAAGYAARAVQRQKLLATLRKLDVTAMQDYKTWKGLLEQVQLKNIMFEQQLTAYSKALEAGCNPATAKQNVHYTNALTLAHDSGQLQKMFLASFNPVAKKYNIPMQSQGNL